MDTKFCRTCKTMQPLCEFYESENVRERGRCKACEKARTAEYRRRKPEVARRNCRDSNKRLKREMVAAYGGKCECCGESDIEFLTIDHIYGDGQQHAKQVGGTGVFIYRDLRKRGFPKDRYRLFCMNCNMAVKYGKTCPHQRAKKKEEEKRLMIDALDPIYGSQFNDTGITPSGYKVLVEIPKPPAKKAGLIHVPESVQKKEQNQAVVAKVLQLGPYCYKDETRYPEELGPWCRPGDFIAMSPYNGTNISLPGSDRMLRFINEDSIDGIVPDPSSIERY